jgi:hypothetical protein
MVFRTLPSYEFLRYLSPRSQSRKRVINPGWLAPPQAGHLPAPRQVLQCSSGVFRRVFLPDPKHFGHSPEPPHIGHLERKIGNATHPSFDFALAVPDSDLAGLRFEDELKRRN